MQTIDRKEAHRNRMAKRRVAQLARTAGFTPVRNARVEGMLSAEQMRLTMMGRAPADAQFEARQNVAKRLPPVTGTKLYRPRPSKSDSPVYRKQATA